jgi:hypothetical protein
LRRIGARLDMCWRRRRQEYIRMQIRSVGIAFDDIRKGSVRYHRCRGRIESLVKPEEPVAISQGRKLIRDNPLERRSHDRTRGMAVRQPAHE